MNDERIISITEYAEIMNAWIDELRNRMNNYIKDINEVATQSESNYEMIKAVENEYSRIGRELIAFFSELMKEL